MDDINKWLNRVKEGEKLRDQADERYGYTRSLKEYRGLYSEVMPSFMKDTAVVPINEVYGYTKAFIPSVYSRDPYVAFNAKGYKSIASSKLLEAGVNAYWRELRLKRQIRRCVFDAIFAEGWMKTGFSSTFGSIKPKEGQTPLEANEFVRNDEIFSTRVSWRHMVKDPDAVDGIHDARWVGQKIIRPLSAVVSSPLYTAKNIVATHVDNGDTQTSSDKKKGAESAGEEFIEFYEIWDMDSEEILWVSEGCADEYMRESAPWPKECEGYPFDLLRFNDDSDEAYVPNLISSWEPQLWEKIKIRSMQLDHIKRFNRQLWAPEGSVSAEQAEKFSRGDTGAINFFQGATAPAPMPYPQIQTDIYAVENRIDMDKDNISGQPNVVRSAPQRTQTRTLGELQTMISSFQFRQVDPKSEVEDFCGEIAIKVAAAMKAHLPGEKWAKVSQQDLPVLIKAFGVERWDGHRFMFTREDIKDAEYEVDVKVGSTLPLDPQGRTDALVNILKLGPTIGIGPNSKLAAVAGKSVINQFEMKEVEQAYDEDLAIRHRAEVVARAAMQAKQGMIEDKLATTRARVEAGGVPPPAAEEVSGGMQ